MYCMSSYFKTEKKNIKKIVFRVCELWLKLISICFIGLRYLYNTLKVSGPWIKGICIKD